MLILAFSFGYFFAIKEIRDLYFDQQKAKVLGSIVTKTEKSQIINSYSRPSLAAKELGNYSWDVPTENLPFIGNAPKPGTHENASINSFNMRNAKDPVIPKPKSNVRIILIGGSTAYSSGAPSQKKTIGGILEAKINASKNLNNNLNYEVFTLASPGWTSTHERIIVENRLLDLDPDIVISLSGNNDCHWSALGNNIFWFRTYADTFSWEVIKTAYSNSFLPEKKELIIPADNKIRPEIVTNRLIRNLKLISHALSYINCEYYFFLQPTLIVTDKELNQYEASRINEDWKSYFNECYYLFDQNINSIESKNLKYFNASSVFDSLGADNQVFLDMYHFGDKGNLIIANYIFEKIFESLKRNKLRL